LAKTLPTLSAHYLGINPSRARLPQYTADIALVLVTTLTLSMLLQRDLSHSDLGVESTLQGEDGKRSMFFRDVLPVGNHPLESGLRPQDAAHQTVLANLGIIKLHCEALAGVLALLQAPASLLAEFLRAPVRGEKQGQRKDGLEGLAEAIVSIDMRQLAESLEASIELNETFNVLVSDTRLGDPLKPCISLLVSIPLCILTAKYTSTRARVYRRRAEKWVRTGRRRGWRGSKQTAAHGRCSQTMW
jgi:hypothetical protein